MVCFEQSLPYVTCFQISERKIIELCGKLSKSDRQACENLCSHQVLETFCGLNGTAKSTG